MNGVLVISNVASRLHRGKPKETDRLLGRWRVENVLDGGAGGENLVSLSIGDLNAKLLLKGHDELDGVEAVETEVIAEVDSRCYLGGIDLAERLDDVQDALLDLGAVKAGGGGKGARAKDGELRKRRKKRQGKEKERLLVSFPASAFH